MARTTVATVVAGQKVAATGHGNKVAAAIAELQEDLSDAAETWTSPVASGLTTTSGTIDALFARHGALVTCFFQFTFGASSAVTGDIVLNLPVAASRTGSIHGWATLTDTGTAVYKGYVQGVSATQAHIRTMSVGGTYPTAAILSATVPHTWGNTDVITCQFSYLVA